MRSMRQLETENIAPEGQRTLEVRDSDTGVIGGNDAKWRSTHASWLRAVSPQMNTDQTQIGKLTFPLNP
jgi:hypothetical protein